MKSIETAGKFFVASLAAATSVGIASEAAGASVDHSSAVPFGTTVGKIATDIDKLHTATTQMTTGPNEEGQYQYEATENLPNGGYLDMIIRSSGVSVVDGKTRPSPNPKEISQITVAYTIPRKTPTSSEYTYNFLVGKASNGQWSDESELGDGATAGEITGVFDSTTAEKMNGAFVTTIHNKAVVAEHLSKIGVFIEQIAANADSFHNPPSMNEVPRL